MKTPEKYLTLKVMNGNSGGGGGLRGLTPLKKQKSLDRYGSTNANNSNTAKSKASLMRQARSQDDDFNEDEADENDELSQSEDAAVAAKMAEEAYAANLKMLKKQKAKFLRLQKILSRNVILIPLCAIFSVLSAFSIFASTLTDHFELISYDVNNLRRQIELENNRSLAHLNHQAGLNMTMGDFLAAVRTRSFDPAPVTGISSSSTTRSSTVATAERTPSPYINDLGERRLEVIREHLQATFVYELSDIILDYYVVWRMTYPAVGSNAEQVNSTFKTNILYETHSGIWKFCNYLSNESRNTLKVEKCTFYKTTNIEQDTTVDFRSSDPDHSDRGRDLIRMHNAAACCTIVSYFLLIVSWITGLTAAFTKRVPVSLASWVLNLLIAVFLFLMLAIFHRKILIEGRRFECLDLKNFFEIVCSSRTVKFGYSLGLTWLAFIFTSINAICWLQITKMQKLLFAHGYYYN